MQPWSVTASYHIPPPRLRRSWTRSKTWMSVIFMHTIRLNTIRLFGNQVGNHRLSTVLSQDPFRRRILQRWAIHTRELRYKDIVHTHNIVSLDLSLYVSRQCASPSSQPCLEVQHLKLIWMSNNCTIPIQIRSFFEFFAQFAVRNFDVSIVCQNLR